MVPFDRRSVRNGKKGTATICRNGPKGARGGIRAASKYVDHCLGGTSLVAAKGVAAGETTPFAALRDVPPLLELEFAGPVASAAVETTPFAALRDVPPLLELEFAGPVASAAVETTPFAALRERATPSEIRVRRPSGFRCRASRPRPPARRPPRSAAAWSYSRIP